jgi:hypothetical protein
VSAVAVLIVTELMRQFVNAQVEAFEVYKLKNQTSLYHICIGLNTACICNGKHMPCREKIFPMCADFSTRKNIPFHTQKSDVLEMTQDEA